MSPSPHLLAVLGLTVAGTLLAGCGADPDSDAGETAPEETSSTSASPEASGTRVVQGAYGEIEIPAEPQRIFADLMTVDYLTALGFDTERIVGVFGADWFAQQPDHYLDDFFERDDLVDPGEVFEANVEAVAAARPDLILVPFDQIDGVETQDELARVAPLLAVPTGENRDSEEVRYGGTASFQDWRTTLRTYGELLGLEDQAESYIAETEAELDDLRTEYADTIDAITVTQANSTPDYMVINALSEAESAGVLGTILLSELGFHSPPQQVGIEPDEWGTIELSAENLDLVDGDLLFLEVRDNADAHEKSPLWPTLQVVQNGGVHQVGNHWEFGGAVAAREVVDDIEDALEDLDQT